MIFINMNVINFYESISLKINSFDDKRSSTRNCNIFIVDEKYKSDQVFESINRSSENFQDNDLIEILKIIISLSDKFLDFYDKMKAVVNDDKLNAANELFDFIILTRIENFAYTTNEHDINREHNCISSDTNQNLSNLDELLFDITESQKSQQTKENDVRLKMLNESFDRVIEND